MQKRLAASMNTIRTDPLFDLFQNDDVAPAGGGVLAFVVLFHGVGEDIGLALPARLGVLLGTNDDGLRAVAFVETVDHLIQSAQLLDLLGIHIEEVLLDGAVGSNAHDNHPTPLVLHPLNEYPVQHLACRLHNGDGGAGGSDEPLLVVFPVLQQVFPEGVAADKHTHDGGHRILSSQLLGTTAGIVGDMRPEGVLVVDHAIERPAGADALLLGQLFIGHAILAIQLLPGSDDIDIVEGLANPRLMMLGKVVGRLTAQGVQLLGIPSAYAPHIVYGQPFQGSYAILIAVDDAAVPVVGVFLGQLRGNLGEGLVGCKADADGHPHPLPDLLMQVLAPSLQVKVLHAVEIDETLVDGIAEVGRRLLADDAYHPSCQVAIQLIVTAEDGYLFIAKLLCHLEIRRTLFDAQGLGLIASGHHATIVVA